MVATIVPRDDEFRQAWMDGVPVRDLARKYKVAQGTISSTAKSMGLPVRVRGHRSKIADDALFRSLWNSKQTLRQIGNVYGVTAARVSAFAKSVGLPSRQHVPSAPPPRRAKPAAEIEPEQDTPDTATLVGQLVASNGRYAALAEIAERHGLTLAETQRRYHAARCAA